MTATYGDAVAAGRAALDVLGSQVVPTAVELDGPRDAVRVTVLVEGVEAGVDARSDTLLSLLGPGAVAHDDPPPGFGALPFAAGGTGLKVTTSLTGVGPVLAAAHRLADEQGLELRVGGSAAGVLHAGLAADADAAAVAASRRGAAGRRRRRTTAPSPSSPHRPRSAPPSTRGDRYPAST